MDGGIPVNYYIDPEWGYTHIDSTDLVVESWLKRLDDIIEEIDVLKKEKYGYRKRSGKEYERS